jgi:hypothetical protein
LRTAVSLSLADLDILNTKKRVRLATSVGLQRHSCFYYKSFLEAFSQSNVFCNLSLSRLSFSNLGKTAAVVPIFIEGNIVSGSRYFFFFPEALRPDSGSRAPLTGLGDHTNGTHHSR